MCKNSSVLQSVQTRSLVSLTRIKGVSGAASLGNTATAVCSEQLICQSNDDVKNKWRYTTSSKQAGLGSQRKADKLIPPPPPLINMEIRFK